MNRINKEDFIAQVVAPRQKQYRFEKEKNQQLSKKELSEKLENEVQEFLKNKANQIVEVPLGKSFELSSEKSSLDSSINRTKIENKQLRMNAQKELLNLYAENICSDWGVLAVEVGGISSSSLRRASKGTLEIVQAWGSVKAHIERKLNELPKSGDKAA